MKPIKVLQVVGGMNRGGIETWLMHVLRRTDPRRFEIDFLVHTTEACAYDAEVHALGRTIRPCLHPSRPLAYRRNLLRILGEHGPYDIIHSHVHHFTGYILRLARRAKVKGRIAHSHLDTYATDAEASFSRKCYCGLARHWINTHATLGLAASAKAATALFGPSWQGDQRFQLHFCAVDPEPFRAPIDRAEVRAELGLAPDALVLGHVGRFAEQKNHAFLIDIAAEVVRWQPAVRVLLLGEGPLLPAIQKRVAQRNLQNHVLFLGSRPDVTRLLRAMDVFVLPSLYEGLPLVGIEAQAAGLPLVLSNTVAPELDFIPRNIKRLSLAQPVAEWARSILSFRHLGAPVSRAQALETFLQSPFNLENGLAQLEACYHAQVGHNRN